MALVRRRREVLAGEHVPLVPAAVGAADLDALHPHRVVLDAGDGPLDVVVEGRPAASLFFKKEEKEGWCIVG